MSNFIYGVLMLGGAVVLGMMFAHLVLAEHGPMSSPQMAQMLGTSTQHVNYYVKAMGLEVVGSEKISAIHIRMSNSNFTTDNVNDVIQI